MTEYEALLVLPDVMTYKSKRLNKRHYDISPYWNAVYFNARIVELKKGFEHINNIYLLKDPDFMDFFRKLVDSGVLEGLDD
jgi:hypothetical protein